MPVKCSENTVAVIIQDKILILGKEETRVVDRVPEADYRKRKCNEKG